MNNFISIVNNFNLVIYTNANSFPFIDTILNLNPNPNPNIKIIIKPFEDFYGYKYKDFWIENHKRNTSLNNNTDWSVNMLWSEKIWFVNETIKNMYFDTELHGWCDIGYFRNRDCDLNTKFLSNWLNPELKIIKLFDKNKIHYGCVNNDINYMKYLHEIINNKNSIGLPQIKIPNDQISIAGGFFILHKDKIDWWSNTYDNKLKLYFENGYLVKDDQIILADCILSQRDQFILFKEDNIPYDNWFMFQRILNFTSL
jgi:hypothetical protein